MTTAWTSRHLDKLDLQAASRTPLVTGIDRTGLAAGNIYWDMWPVQDADGRPARIMGREFWMALTAPDRQAPSLRHFEAKIRLLERLADGWADRGPVLPSFTVPYEREWAGSCTTDGQYVTLYFTAAGTSRRPGGYQQALYEAHGKIGPDGLPQSWSPPRPSLRSITTDYMPADAHEGEAGKIKAFRDPAWFRDPADGAEYLIFTASLANSVSEYNGAVGIAKKQADSWQLLPPLIHADGLNNELERAHVVFHAGRYYAFWATQRRTFAPGLRQAPNGLYGMVSDTLFGEYRPLNDSGLVIGNPDSEPFQTYSWFVTADLEVSSFIDFWGLQGRPVPADPAEANGHFGGVPAPLLQLVIDGDRCILADPPFV